MLSECSLGVIGLGNMAEAIVRGVIASGAMDPEEIFATRRDRHELTRLADELGFSVATDNVDLVQAVDIVILGVKPHQYASVLSEIQGELAGKILISVAAGLTCAQLEAMAGPEVEVVRTMPNTPALVQQGCTGICAGSKTSEESLSIAWELLESVGEVVEVEEEDMNSLTAVSGSGPAYFFYFTELLAQAGVSLGLSPEQAEELAEQTLIGAASLLSSSEESVAVLRERVTSPGGMTQAALLSMDEDGLDEVVTQAVQAARDRGLEMAAEADEA